MSALASSMAALFGVLQNPVIPTEPLTITEAANLAVQNAFAVRIQRAAVEKSRQEVKASQAQLGPTLSGNLQYLRNTEQMTQSFGSFSVVTQAIDQKSGGLSLTMPIDILGIQRRQIDASRAAYRSNKRTLEAQFDDAKLLARTDYLAILRALANIEVDKAALTDAQERLSQAQKQLAQQEVAKIDVMAFDTNVTQAKADLLVDQNNLELAKEALNYVLAIPIETQIQVVDIPDLPTAPTDPAPLVQLGQNRRPDVKAIKETVLQLAYIRRATEAGLTPSLNLGLNFSNNFDPLPGDQATTANGTLTLTVPLFDSGLTRAKVKAARQDELTAQLQLQQALLGVSQDVRSAVASLISAHARFDNATAQVGYAQETFRLAKIKQNAAEGTYVETIDAENNLTIAKNGLNGARYDYLTAYAQLQKAVGADHLEIALGSAATPNSRGKN